MYIINPGILKNTFACRKRVAKILTEEHEIPILYQEDGIYYFAKNEKLNSVVERIPILIQFLDDMGW